MIETDVAIPESPISLSFWPRYLNPYQDLFYGSENTHVAIRSETIGEALARSDEPNTIRCFHLHWLNTVVNKKHYAWRVRWSVGRFLRKLRRFKRRGGVVVWTIHNLASHDTPHPGIDARLGAAVGEIADIVLLHGPAAVRPARDIFPAIAGKELIVPHGNYIDAYRNRLSRVEARKILKIEPDATTLICFGAVRPYKGLANLIRTIGRCEDLRNGYHLVIAGRPSDIYEAELRQIALAAGVSVTFDLRQIPADEVEVFLNSGDWMVLPYRDVLTSGSAMLAMSFALPVLAPRLGLIPELIRDGVEGFLYEPARQDGLELVLRRALGTDPAQQAHMAEAALHRASGVSWSTGRQALLAEVRAVHARNRDPGATDGRTAIWRPDAGHSLAAG